MVAILTDRARAVAIITTITRELQLVLRQGLWQWSWLGIITTITRGLPLGLRTTPPSL
jgi:hypothetical protein